MLADIYPDIRSSIVAFVPKYPALYNPQLGEQDYLSCIIGTGFIVGDSAIATNKHVIDECKKLPKPDDDENEYPFRVLYYVKKESNITGCFFSVCRTGFMRDVGRFGHYYAPEVPDIALVVVACTGLMKHALKCDSVAVSAGTEIATAGYPMGSALLASGGTLDRFGPVLQRGIVSAVCPVWDVDPHAYIIDIMIQGGASGSPVFRINDGRVIGVVNALRREPVVATGRDLELTVHLPTNFGYVVPATLLCQLMEKGEKELLGSVPENASSLDELIAAIPKEVDEITIIEHRNSPGSANAQ